MQQEALNLSLVQPVDEIDIAKEFALSGKTAISRPGVSLPLRFLLERGVFQGAKSAINFAKGRASHDAPAIAQAIEGDVCAEFDLIHAPEWPVFGTQYSVLFSGYCANVLPPRCRSIFWRQVALLTDEYGRAYVAVRSCKDRAIKGKPEYDGVRTSIGSFQKGYSAGDLMDEARRFFPHVELLQPNESKGFLIVACKHCLHLQG
ncbi:MAG: hypothetical protein V7752_20690 [Halopseudomonas sp.]